MASGNYKFIVVEGIDGSGKSTVAAEVAKMIGGVLLRTPPQEFDAIRPIFDGDVSLGSRFLFYLLGVACVSDAAKKALTTSHVVCDRYVASTFAYHEALGLDIKVDCGNFDLIEPDLAFLLTIADEDERQKRLLNRSEKTFSDIWFDGEESRQVLCRAYGRFDMHEIDTTGRTVNQVVNSICKFMC